MVKRTRLATTNDLKKILLYLNQDNILKTRRNICINTGIGSNVINNAMAFLKNVDLVIEVKEDRKTYQLVRESFIGKLNSEDNLNSSQP